MDPIIDRIFTFDEVPVAYEHLASGSHVGKVVNHQVLQLFVRPLFRCSLILGSSCYTINEPRELRELISAQYRFQKDLKVDRLTLHLGSA